MYKYLFVGCRFKVELSHLSKQVCVSFSDKFFETKTVALSKSNSNGVISWMSTSMELKKVGYFASITIGVRQHGVIFTC